MEEALQLSTQQKLQQRLTPQQVQFVRILEMTGPEVEEEVRRAVDENPALETAERDDKDNLDSLADEGFNESAEQMQLADYRSEDDIPTYRLEARNHSVNDEYYEPVAVAGGDTIMEMLSAQLAEFELSERQLTIADYIIGNIDDNGYLSRGLMSIGDDIAIHTGIDTTIEEVRQVFDIVRSLEPAGIAAIDLRDCLLLQLRRKTQTPDVALAKEIIADYFDLFSKKHYDRLKSMLSIDGDQLKAAIAEICTLNPKPGSIIGGGIDDRTRHIIPDFSVEVDGNKAITVTLLNNIPDLQIEATFADDNISVPAATSRQEREARLFIRQKRDEAGNFIKMLKLRQETLYRVMTAIVKLQRDFFLTEEESRIRPMILKDIAALTGYDLSVISRAASGKYVMTQSGTYPLKMFFNERPKDDDDASSHEILAALKDIIAGEDKRHPLSDEVITSRLNEKGYDIARRTVAKYREKLGLPVARLRKEI